MREWDTEGNVKSFRYLQPLLGISEWIYGTVWEAAEGVDATRNPGHIGIPVVCRAFYDNPESLSDGYRSYLGFRARSVRPFGSFMSALGRDFDMD